MSTLLAARMLMAISLGFHIIFASIGMTIPFFMVVAYWRYLKHKDPVDLYLTKMWSKGTAILFATGAVSGTVLSFELGLLWPKFMEKAGPIFGMPFSWEGTAFFLEAISLGLFLYGWKKMPPKIHFLSGVAVGVFGFLSGIFVLSANAWMNAPTGFVWNNGNPIEIDPLAAMFNDAWFQQSVHMQLAAFVATGFAVAGLHASLYLKNLKKDLHLRAFKIAMSFASVAAVLIPFSGHYSAQWVAKNQPAKLAAMEAHFHTEKYAPLILGGLPNIETKEVPWSIQIPGGLSFLAFNRFDAEVIGLDDIPSEEHPPVLVTHLAFQIMVSIGTLLASLGGLFIFLKIWKKPIPEWFYRAVKYSMPLGFIAMESGWIVTEVGRQPWIIYGFMKTKDSVTDVPGIQIHLMIFTLIYVFLSVMCVHLMKRMINQYHQDDYL